MKTFEFYTNPNDGMCCIVGTTYSFQGYDEMLHWMAKDFEGQKLDFVEVPVPENMDWEENHLTW